MPYINIKITRESLTQEQKAKLIKGTTEVTEKVLSQKNRTTLVIIEEVDTDNWGIHGEQITIRRQKKIN
jgi:4-oxalocrotonate tautomerase